MSKDVLEPPNIAVELSKLALFPLTFSVGLLAIAGEIITDRLKLILDNSSRYPGAKAAAIFVNDRQVDSSSGLILNSQPEVLPPQ